MQSQKKSSLFEWVVVGVVAVLILGVLVLFSGILRSDPVRQETSVATVLTPSNTVPTKNPTATVEPTLATKASPTAVAMSTNTLVPTVAATSTPKPQQFFLGDFVEQYGYAIAALTVENPATPSRLYEVKPGKKLIAVEIIVGNVSGKPIGVNPLYVTLFDSEGFAHQTELGGRDNQIATIHLYQGEKVRGWVAFEVPEETKAVSIKYRIETFGNQFIQASLIPPITGHETIAQSESPPLVNSLPKLGEVAEGFGYLISATNVENPTKPSNLYEPRTGGYKLVGVEVIAGNVSGEILSVNPLYVILIDADGFVYRAELGGRDGQIATGKLSAGEKIKGWVAFTIPENAVPSSIRYELDLISADRVLQTGLN